MLNLEEGGKTLWPSLVIEAVSEETLDREKCIRQLARNVAVNAKFHSSLQKVSLSIAGTAMRKGRDINSSLV